MDLAQQKEKFSDAYLQAVAAVAGFALASPRPDNDSVDWVISSRRTAELPRAPRLEVQLKCTARDIVRSDQLHYPLKMKNYNDLRDFGVLVPRILVVVLVPEYVSEWLLQSEENLRMCHCGYWVSLRGAPELVNTTRVTVNVPRNQIFTPDELRRMMQRINDTEAL